MANHYVDIQVVLYPCFQALSANTTTKFRISCFAMKHELQNYLGNIRKEKVSRILYLSVKFYKCQIKPQCSESSCNARDQPLKLYRVLFSLRVDGIKKLSWWTLCTPLRPSV